MLRTSTVFIVSLFAIALLLLAPTVSKADWFNRVTCNNCRYHLNGSAAATSVTVLATTTFNSATNVLQAYGTVAVNSGTTVVSTTVVAQKYSTVTVGSATYKCAVVTSKVFYYADRVNNTGYPAHLVVTLTQCGKGGQAGYTVIRESDGAIVDQSATSGAYVEAPFDYGSILIQ